MVTRFKKALLTSVTVLALGSALAVSATPASARDAGPVIAGALGGFAAGAILGSTLGHHGNYGGGYYSSGYYPSEDYAPVYTRSCYPERRPIYDSWGDFAGYRHVRVCD
jgi:hypothetical protein